MSQSLAYYPDGEDALVLRLMGIQDDLPDGIEARDLLTGVADLGEGIAELVSDLEALAELFDEGRVTRMRPNLQLTGRDGLV